MRAAIVSFPGSNCDQDCYLSVEAAGGSPMYVWHRDTELGDVDAVVLPGGFAHGDYLRPGAIARFSPIMGAIVEFAKSGGLVLGICNGFQILCEAGLLPGGLLRNESLRFQSHDCHIRVETQDTPFTRDYAAGQVLSMPLSHADGNYHVDPETLASLHAENRVVFRYCDPQGVTGPKTNPNGSVDNIAGVLNGWGNVMGMMPHPDRATDPWLRSTDGLGLFRSLVDAGLDALGVLGR